MDFSEYVERASATDTITDLEKAILIGLLGIAGEAGSVVSEAKKWFRDGALSPGLRDCVQEELGDLLWYIALVARRLEIDLNAVAEANLRKVNELWSPEMPGLPDYDDHPYDLQKFPRKMTIRFEEDRSGDLPVVRLFPEGELAQLVQEQMPKCQIGDDVDDNAMANDGYRYHDIIHIGHATVLGWSPVLRALIGVKRRDVGDYDRVQDGGRAIAIEEALTAFVFNYLKPYYFAPQEMNWDFFKNIRIIVRGLEVENQPVTAWRSAYTQAFEIFTQLNEQRGGTVMCDLDMRKLTLID